MSKILFQSGVKLGSMHKFMLSHLIQSCIKEYKYHKYDPNTNLVVFYNDKIFGSLCFGKKAYKSLIEVIKYGIIPVLAEHKVRSKEEKDLIKAQLELEINVEQYLERDELGKAIEILMATILEKPQKELTLDINEVGDGKNQLALTSPEPVQQGETFNLIIRQAPDNLSRENKSKVAAGFMQAYSMPVTFMSDE